MIDRNRRNRQVKPDSSNDTDASAEHTLSEDDFAKMRLMLLDIVEPIAKRGCSPQNVRENVISLILLIDRAREDMTLRDLIIEFTLDHLYMETEACGEAKAKYLRAVMHEQDCVLAGEVAK